MPQRPSKCSKCKVILERLPLPDDSANGDYYCPTCQNRWFSERTVEWAVHKYFSLAGCTPQLVVNQREQEGDIRVTHLLKREEWIIEAKGQAPAGSDSISFQEGLGQILQARYKRDPHIIYALAMPQSEPFIQKADRINGKDREFLRLHWIWVEQVEGSHCTHFEVTINCPPGCECQKRIGTYSFW